MELIENESPLLSAVWRVFGGGHCGKGDAKTENDLNISVPFFCRAGHLNSTSAPNVSHKRGCEYDYTLISRSLTQNTELGTDWQEEMSSRTLFAGVADLFVCNRVAPRLRVICQLKQSSGIWIKR